MNTIITKRFEEMGARVKIRNAPDRLRSFDTGGGRSSSVGIPRLDVLTDNKGEYFDIRFPSHLTPAQVDVVDINPKDRHLLLLVKEDDGKGHINKSKFLCGHDERHWFVAAIPEAIPGIGSITKAKEALQPSALRNILASSGLSNKERLKRKNEVYLRQGEWFFIPQKSLNVDKDMILRNEPLTRGRGSKPHNMELCYRSGGETVYVNRQHPTGITQKAFDKLPPDERKGWQVMVRNAQVYAKGKISHADHATIFLPDWCLVMMNTENQAAAMRHVAFLD